MPRYFTKKNDRVEGPFIAGKIRELATAGKLLPTDLIQIEGQERWVFARQVAGLFPAAEAGKASAVKAAPSIAPPNSTTASQKPAAPPRPAAPHSESPIAMPAPVTQPAHEIVEVEIVEEEPSSAGAAVAPAAVAVSPAPAPSGPGGGSLKDLDKAASEMMTGFLGMFGAKPAMPASSQQPTAIAPAAPLVLPSTLAAPAPATTPPTPAQPTFGFASAVNSLFAPTASAAQPLADDAPVVATSSTAPRLPPGTAADQVVAQVSAAYLGGHPRYTEKLVGSLFLAADGLWLLAEKAEQDIFIPYSTLLDISEPRTGAFPEAMVKQAKLAQSAAKAGNAVAGMAGMLGKLSRMSGSGDDQNSAAALSMFGSVGKIASRGVAAATKLGPPPKNRLLGLIVHEGKKHKIAFDVQDASTAEMGRLAQEFWHKVALIRGRMGRKPPGSAATTSKPAIGHSPSPVTRPVESFSQNTGFRIIRQGQVEGPIGLAELQQLVSSGALSATDLVAVEAWVPIGCLGMLHGTPASSGQSPGAQSLGSVAAVSPASVAAGQGSGVSPWLAAAGGAAVGAAAGAAAMALASRGSRAAGRVRAPSSNPMLVDRNHDGRPDGVAMDTDGDGQVDSVGMDRDGDGRIDTVGVDGDGDGQIDTLGIDRDGDGRLDAVGIDRDHDGDIDAVGVDVDHDGDIDMVGVDHDGDGDVDQWAEVEGGDASFEIDSGDFDSGGGDLGDGGGFDFGEISE